MWKWDEGWDLADVGRKAVDAGLREWGAVVPDELVVDGERTDGDDMSADGESHPRAVAEGRDGGVVAAEDAGSRCGEHPDHRLDGGTRDDGEEPTGGWGPGTAGR